MTQEALGSPSEDRLGEWLDGSEPLKIHGALFLLWEKGSCHFQPGIFHDYQCDASTVQCNREIDKLYSSVYPEATPTERYRLIHLDLQAMVQHHYLLKSLDVSSASAELGRRQVHPILFGSSPEDLNIYNVYRRVSFDNTPAVYRRITQGMSSEMKAVTAAVRLRAPGNQFTQSYWPHDLAWVQDQVFETLQLSPEEIDQLHKLQATEDAYQSARA